MSRDRAHQKQVRLSTRERDREVVGVSHQFWLFSLSSSRVEREIREAEQAEERGTATAERLSTSSLERESYVWSF